MSGGSGLAEGAVAEHVEQDADALAGEAEEGLRGRGRVACRSRCREAASASIQAKVERNMARLSCRFPPRWACSRGSKSGRFRGGGEAGVGGEVGGCGGAGCRAVCNPSNRHSPSSRAARLFLHLLLISVPHTAPMYITGDGARSASWRSKAVRPGLLPWRTCPTATHACAESGPRRSRHDDTVEGELCPHTEGRSLHRRCATAKTRRNAHR